jgi:hypothetical protein
MIAEKVAQLESLGYHDPVGNNTKQHKLLKFIAMQHGDVERTYAAKCNIENAPPRCNIHPDGIERDITALKKEFREPWRQPLASAA